MDDNHAPLAFFEVDVDLWDIRLKNVSERQLRADFDLFRKTCNERPIPLRFIATGTHATSAKEYRDETLKIVQLVRKLGVAMDGVTVQSWTEYALRREIPPNLPSADSTSHLGILGTILGS